MTSAARSVCCFRPILVAAQRGGEASDVDHFYPHILMSRGLPIDLDQVWNLVLACATCNRGAAGKMASLPHDRYLQRLRRRNEYLIGSHHPLRETLILHTGTTARDRNRFLAGILDTAKDLVGSRTGWTARDEQQPTF